MMFRLFWSLPFVWLLLSSQAARPADALANQLADHPSPYLAMHATDPVAWQDWDAAIFERARAEQKLVYVSVGYFSCHWCHVMQRESYKNEKIARLLNQFFIPVKVDRELEPALDERLIDFSEQTLGQAGWPLNAFLTPDGDPLYVVLYLPRENFAQVLHKLNELWADPDDRRKLVRMAHRESQQAITVGSAALDPVRVAAYVKNFVQTAKAKGDLMNGGFGSQNKFPSAPQLLVLLDHYARQPDPELGRFLELTLDQMADNGLRDHLGGGFFRYTVDPSWETPHFEKMLYDNALLARVYLRASKVLGKNEYSDIARVTLDFMIRDMLGDGPAMVASFSAVDDGNVEGGYYLFSEGQLAELLTGAEREVIKRAFRMRDAAPFDAGFLPMRGEDVTTIARALGRSEQQVARLLGSGTRKLVAARSRRVLPTDTKLLAGWNGLALASLAQAARVFNEPRYRRAGQRVRDYLVNRLWDGRQLRRAVVDGRAVGQVSLQDYAFVALGLWHWARVTGEPGDYRQLREIVDQGWKRFYRDGGWRRSESSLLAQARLEEALADGPMPSASAVFGMVSLALARHDDAAPRLEKARRALNTGAVRLRQAPFWHATQIGALSNSLEP